MIAAAPGAARPFKTLYYEARYGDGWSTCGSAASDTGAIRAAIVRVFLHQYERAEIYEAGVLIYTVRRTQQGITVNYGASGTVH